MAQRVVTAFILLIVLAFFGLHIQEHSEQMGILSSLVESSLRQLSDLREHQKGTETALEARTDDLEEQMKGLALTHKDTLSELNRVRGKLTPDVDRLYREILYPSVQVSGNTGVGGGVILHSREDETYIVTAFHVIENVVRKENGKEVRDPVEVQFYDAKGEPSLTLDGELILFDKKQDVALVRVPGTGVLENVAKLASRETLRKIRVFTPIYAVGCPLGHDPLPSNGEIMSLDKEVDGVQFWMMNAPTIYGNSGGGIFHRETHELLGISSMICTFDNRGSTPVPHLGIMLSLDEIYDWLDEEIFSFLYNPAVTEEECARQRAATSRPLRAAKTRIEW